MHQVRGVTRSGIKWRGLACPLWGTDLQNTRIGVGRGEKRGIWSAQTMNGHPGLAKVFGLCLKRLLRDLKHRMRQWVALGKVVVAQRGQTKARSVRKAGPWSGEGHNQCQPGQVPGQGGRGGGQFCQHLVQRLVGQGTQMA